MQNTVQPHLCNGLIWVHYHTWWFHHQLLFSSMIVKTNCKKIGNLKLAYSSLFTYWTLLLILHLILKNTYVFNRPCLRVFYLGLNENLGEPGNTREWILLPHLETHDNNYGCLLLVGVLWGGERFRQSCYWWLSHISWLSKLLKRKF